MIEIANTESGTTTFLDIIIIHRFIEHLLHACHGSKFCKYISFSPQKSMKSYCYFHFIDDEIETEDPGKW